MTCTRHCSASFDQRLIQNLRRPQINLKMDQGSSSCYSRSPSLKMTWKIIRFEKQGSGKDNRLDRAENRIECLNLRTFFFVISSYFLHNRRKVQSTYTELPDYFDKSDQKLANFQKGSYFLTLLLSNHSNNLK